MSKQIIWLVFAVVLIGLATVGYLYWQKEPAIPKEREVTVKEKTKTGLTNLEQALEKTNSASIPNVPSANPLQKIAPVKNPIEVTNPFNDGYQNPFQ